MTRSQRYFLMAAIGLSALLIILATALQTGYENTPYGIRDSQGNPLGFNEPITAELYGILLRNVDWNGFVKYLGWYGVLCLVLHAIGFIIVGSLHTSQSTWRRMFFLAQLVLFPLGWLGVLFVPLFLLMFSTGKLDGEGVSDLPLNLLFTALWIAISFYLAVFHYHFSRSPKLQTA
jgi:hypothetical protein